MISLIIPCFNEAKRLKDSLQKLSAYLKTFPGEVEVIIADDGSRDATVSLAKSLQGKFKQFQILELPHAGKGAAVKAGFWAAKGEQVVFTDADFSTPISELPKLLAPLEEGYDLAIGSRALDRSLVKVHQNFLRELVGKLSNILIRTLAVRGIYDTQCGFKAYRKASCETIFEKQTINGFAFDIELLFLAQRQGLKIKEVPVEWYNDPRSSVKAGKDTLASFMDLLRIRLRHSHDGQGTANRALRVVHRHHTYTRYFLVGATSTTVDYTVYLVLTRLFHLDPLQANPFGVEAAILWSFTFNNMWTFSKRENKRHPFQRYLVFQFVLLGGLMMSQIQILIFVHSFYLNDIIAKAISGLTVGIFNYNINSRWTFKDVTSNPGLARAYPLLIIALFVVYLILVKRVTGSFSILLPRLN